MAPLTQVALLGGIPGALWVVSTVLAPGSDASATIRVGSGFVLALVLPGFTWSWLLWPRGDIDPIERGVLSLAFSVALLSLGVFAIARIGVPASLGSIAATLAGIEAIGISLIVAFRPKHRSGARL